MPDLAVISIQQVGPAHAILVTDRCMSNLIHDEPSQVQHP